MRSSRTRRRLLACLLAAGRCTGLPAVAEGPPTLAWTAPPAGAVLRLGQPVPLTATASSGRPVHFRVASGPARVAEGAVTATDAGTIVLVAEQAGEAPWLPVAETRTFNQPVVAPETAGRWPEGFRGMPTQVQLEGPRAYVLWNNGEAGHFLILDVSDPAAPTLIGRWTVTAALNGMHVSGRRACVLVHPNSLSVLDLADEARPVRIGRVQTDYFPADVRMAGDFAHVVSGNGRHEVFDLANPAAPVRVGELFAGADKRAVQLAGQRAYVAGGIEGLRVHDVTQPASPRLLGQVDTGPANALHLSGTTAYVATIFDGLRVVDVADASRPRIIATWRSAEPVTMLDSVHVTDGRAYVTDLEAGLRILGVADPSRPVLLGTHGAVPSPRGVAAGGGVALVAGADGLHALNVADAGSITPLARFAAGERGVARDVAVVDELAFVADGASGLQVLELPDAGSPRRLGQVATGGSAYGVAVNGGQVFMAEGAAGWSVVDVSDPAAPRRLGGADTPGWATGIAVEGRRAYVADYGGGLRIFDAGDPANPLPLGHTTGLATSYAVALMGARALVADGPGGLGVVDVGDPAQPVVVATHPTREPALDVAVRGPFAAVANGYELEVFDVSQPASPTRVAVLEVPGGAASVEWDGPFAVVASYSQGVHAVDLSAPARPILLGGVDTAGSAQAATWRDGRLCVADHFDGLKVFRFEVGLPAGLRFEPPAELSFLDSPFRLAATGGGGPPVRFSVVSGPATVAGDQLTFTNAGVVTVRAEQAGDAQFLPARVERSIHVSPGGQGLTWLTPTNRAVLRLGQAQALTATASSGLPVNFVVRHGPAFIADGAVTVTNVGTVVLRAEQPGNAAYRPGFADVTVNRSTVVAQEVGRWSDLLPGREVRDVSVSGARAYLTVVPDGLVILDIANPAAPVQRSAYDPGTSAFSLRHVHGHAAWAYLATGPGHLQVVEAVDPRAPRLSGFVSPPPWVPLAETWDVAVDAAADLLYVAHGKGGLEILDNRQLDLPLTLSRTEIPGEEVRHVRVAGTRCFVATENLLAAFDVTDPTNPRELGRRLLGGLPMELAATRALAAVATAQDGLRLFRVDTESGWPAPLGGFPTGGPARAADLTGNFAFVAADPANVFMLDVANPEELVQAGSLTFFGQARAVQASGGLVFVAAGDGGLLIYRLREGIPQRVPLAGTLDVDPGASPMPLPARSDQGLPLEYAVISGPATVTGLELTLTGPGEVILEGRQAGDAQFLPLFSRKRLIVAAPTARLAVRSVDGGIELSWPAAAGGFILEGAAPSAPPVWGPVPVVPQDGQGTRRVVLPLAEGARLFRLRSP